MNAIATIQSSPAQSAGIRMNALVPNNIAEALQLADIMAKASLIPEHLRNKPGDCLLIVMQAQRWGMDAVSVAQCTSIVKGKLCYEGKLVAAALYSMGVIDGRIRYTYSGSGQSRKVVVAARPRGSSEYVEIEGTVEGWATNNDQWKRDPDGMLGYRGVRQWARRHAPDALLGVYTPDELEDAPTSETTQRATVIESRSNELPMYPEDDFEKNLPTWWGIVASGKRSADDLIAVLQTKSRFTEKQLKEIRNPPKDEEESDAEGEA